MKPLTVDEAWSVLRYCANTGNFYRLRATSKNKAGAVAQYHKGNGYYRLQVNGRQYYAHRLAWFMVYGTWPRIIDHINGNPSDNRISNLRDCSTQANCLNKRVRKDSESGIKGVRLCSHGKWKAQIAVNRKNYYLGYFDTAEEARQAYLKAAEMLHGEFMRAA